MLKLILLISILTSIKAFAAPFCVSHRANGYGEIENSLAALNQAISHEVDAIEFDLLHTKDKETIVYHDKKLKRLVKGENCPLGKLVGQLSLKEIQENCLLENGERIPTLKEALDVLKSGPSKLFIEFKDQATLKDFDLIEEYFKDESERVFIISFDKKILSHVDVLREGRSFYQKIKTVKLQKYGYFANFNAYDVVDAKYIHKRKIKRLQKEGKLVGVYTKDKEKKIKKYLRKGVDFITTNKPQLCARIIQNL